jgi:hypothetical protein
MVLLNQCILLPNIKTSVMKYLFSVIMIAGVVTACNSGADKAAAAQKAQQQTIDSLNIVMAKQRVIDSINRVNDSIETVRARAAKKNTQVVESSGDLSNTSSQAAKKKGWSHTAKGAVVGAGTGAVTGAIINHNDRVKGAAIGAVIGAGVGAGTGLIVDKSVQKKKKKKTSTQQ